MLPDAHHALSLISESFTPPAEFTTPGTFSALKREDFSTSQDPELDMYTAAKAGLLDTHVTIHCVKQLLIPIQHTRGFSAKPLPKPVRNSFQWAGALERHVQHIGLRQLKLEQSKQRLNWNRINSNSQQLARHILRSRMIYIATLGPGHDTRRDEDLLWAEMLSHGDWSTNTIQTFLNVEPLV